MLCPICTPKRDFKSNSCPHSHQQVGQFNEEQRIRAIVRDEIARITKKSPTS